MSNGSQTRVSTIINDSFVPIYQNKYLRIHNAVNDIDKSCQITKYSQKDINNPFVPFNTIV